MKSSRQRRPHVRRDDAKTRKGRAGGWNSTRQVVGYGVESAQNKEVWLWEFDEGDRIEEKSYYLGNMTEASGLRFVFEGNGRKEKGIELIFKLTAAATGRQQDSRTHITTHGH